MLEKDIITDYVYMMKSSLISLRYRVWRASVGEYTSVLKRVALSNLLGTEILPLRPSWILS